MGGRASEKGTAGATSPSVGLDMCAKVKKRSAPSDVATNRTGDGASAEASGSGGWTSTSVLVKSMPKPEQAHANGHPVTFTLLEVARSDWQ